jgi:hypothetical protein
MLVGRHPTEAGQYVLCSSKNNLAPRPRSLAYSLEPSGVVARVGWVGEVDLAAEDVLALPAGRRRQATGEQAAAFVADFLESGERPAAELEAAAKQAGFSKTALKEGRALARVRTRLEGFGKEGRWMVRLPPEDEIPD